MYPHRLSQTLEKAKFLRIINRIDEKTDDSYLLFDTEPTPYQEKRNGEPSVRTFNRTKTLEETKQSEEKNRKKAMVS